MTRHTIITPADGSSTQYSSTWRITVVPVDEDGDLNLRESVTDRYNYLDERQALELRARLAQEANVDELLTRAIRQYFKSVRYQDVDNAKLYAWLCEALVKESTQ